MDQFAPLISAVIPIYLLMVVGGVLRRRDVLTPQMDAGLTRLVIHILYPALILDKILRAELLRDPAVVLSAIGVGLAVIVTGFGVATLVAIVIGLRKGTGRRSFTLSAGIQNYGYVAIPLLIVLTESAEAEAAVLGLLFTHSLGVELAVWTIGMMILRGEPVRSPRELLSGPIVAVVAGLILVFARLDVLAREIPFLNGLLEIFLSLLHWLGLCAFPMGLLLIGTAIADLIGKERFSLRITVGGILVRLVVMPAVILTLAKFLPLVPEFKLVLVVQAAMPAAVTPIVLVRHYGGSPGAAVQVVLATSLAAILTIPIVIGLGRHWIGI